MICFVVTCIIQTTYITAQPVGTSVLKLEDLSGSHARGQLKQHRQWRMLPSRTSLAEAPPGTFNAAMSRERSRGPGRPRVSVGVKQLREQFGVPLGEAAKALGISRTAMKKACRRHGLDEWPYKRRKSKGSAAFSAVEAAVAAPVQPVCLVSDPQAQLQSVPCQVGQRRGHMIHHSAASAQCSKPCVLGACTLPSLRGLFQTPPAQTPQPGALSPLALQLSAFEPALASLQIGHLVRRAPSAPLVSAWPRASSHAYLRLSN